MARDVEKTKPAVNRTGSSSAIDTGHPSLDALSPEDRIAAHLEARPALVDLGQVTPAMKKVLDLRIREGTWFKYRGHWDTLSPCIGMGPLKTIYAPIRDEAEAT